MPDTEDAASFAADIRPLFTDIDIDHMSWFCDLTDHGDVKAHAEAILGRLQGTSGPSMPPASSGGPWSDESIADEHLMSSLGQECAGLGYQRTEFFDRKLVSFSFVGLYAKKIE